MTTAVVVKDDGIDGVAATVGSGAGRIPPDSCAMGGPGGGRTSGYSGGSGLNFLLPWSGSGPREVGRLPHLLVVKGGCRGEFSQRDDQWEPLGHLWPTLRFEGRLVAQGLAPKERFANLAK